MTKRKLSKEDIAKMQKMRKLQEYVKICNISSKYELLVDKRQFIVRSTTNINEATYFPCISHLVYDLLHEKIRENSRKAKTLEDLIAVVEKSEEQVQETAVLIQSHLDEMQKNQSEDQLRMNSMIKCHTE